LINEMVVVLLATNRIWANGSCEWGLLVRRPDMQKDPA
jgi:hypothetical protein